MGRSLAEFRGEICHGDANLLARISAKVPCLAFLEYDAGVCVISVYVLLLLL